MAKNQNLIQKIINSRIFWILLAFFIALTIIISGILISFYVFIRNKQIKIKTSLKELQKSVLLNCSFEPNTKPSKTVCNFGYTGPYCDECGLRFSNEKLKITGGKEAVAHSWPSMALIYFNYKFFYSIKNATFLGETSDLCGGTLIDRNTILTASHCFITNFVYELNGTKIDVKVIPNNFYPTFESMYTIYLGLHDKTLLNSSIPYKIRKFITHSNYNRINKVNDIGLIKLIDNVKLDCKIQPACLPNPKNKNFPDKYEIDLWAIGWGRVFLNGPLPDSLNYVKMTLLNGYFCRNVPPNFKDWSRQLCAGSYTGGLDTCQGDSGGPLFTMDLVNGVEKYVLIGITSYGSFCGLAGFPGIYTKLSFYLDWIEENRNF